MNSELEDSVNNQPDSSDEKSNQRNFCKLVLSVQASPQKLNLLIAICDNSIYRQELIERYEAELTTQAIHCYTIQVTAAQPSLRQALVDLQRSQAWGEPPHLVTVLGANELLSVRLKEGVRSAKADTGCFKVNPSTSPINPRKHPVSRPQRELGWS